MRRRRHEVPGPCLGRRCLLLPVLQPTLVACAVAPHAHAAFGAVINRRQRLRVRAAAFAVLLPVLQPTFVACTVVSTVAPHAHAAFGAVINRRRRLRVRAAACDACCCPGRGSHTPRARHSQSSAAHLAAEIFAGVVPAHTLLANELRGLGSASATGTLAGTTRFCSGKRKKKKDVVCPTDVFPPALHSIYHGAARGISYAHTPRLRPDCAGCSRRWSDFAGGDSCGLRDHDGPCQTRPLI